MLDEVKVYSIVTITAPTKQKQPITLRGNEKWSDGFAFIDANTKRYKEPWPIERGWSDATYYEDNITKIGYMYMFGGLSGTDSNPQRLNDLWKLEVHQMG